MSQLKYYDSGTSSWLPLLAGAIGPQGPAGSGGSTDTIDTVTCIPTGTTPAENGAILEAKYAEAVAKRIIIPAQNGTTTYNMFAMGPGMYDFYGWTTLIQETGITPGGPFTINISSTLYGPAVMTGYVFSPVSGTISSIIGPGWPPFIFGYVSFTVSIPEKVGSARLLIAPGVYEGTFSFTDTNMQVCSLTGHRDVTIQSNTSVSLTAGGDGVTIRGIKAKDTFKMDSCPATCTIQNCAGGQFSFGGNPDYAYGITTYGTFIDCDADTQSFGSYCNGTYIRCFGKNNSFRNGGGKFYYCKGEQSFGAGTGWFYNCIDSGNGFGAPAAGTYVNCVTTSGFAQGGVASGTFINCVAHGYQNFGGGNYGTSCVASGIFVNCYSEGAGFADSNGIASGHFFNCYAGDYSFGPQIQSSGTFINCTGGLASYANWYTNFNGTGASGTYINCVGGGSSWYTQNSGISGKLINCVIAGGGTSFVYRLGGGKLINCVDGNYTLIND